MAHILVLPYDREELISDIKMTILDVIGDTQDSAEVTTSLNNRSNRSPDLIVCDFFQLSQLRVECFSSTAAHPELSKKPIIVIGDDSPNMCCSYLSVPDEKLVGKIGVFAQNHSQTWQHAFNVMNKVLKKLPANSCTPEVFAKTYNQTPTPPMKTVINCGLRSSDCQEERIFKYKTEGLLPK